MKLLQSHSKLTQIQTRLAKQSYLSRANLPGWADGKMFIFLQSIKRYPDRKTYPNFYHWYILMKQFALSSIQKWITNIDSHHDDDPLILEFILNRTNQNLNVKKQQNKQNNTNTNTNNTNTNSNNPNSKQPQPQHLPDDTTPKLIRSQDLTSTNTSNQIEYIMDVKIKQQYKYNMRQLMINFLYNQEVQHQQIQVIQQERRVRIIIKVDALKYQQLKNKMSLLEGVENFQSKKKDKKFQTVNSITSFTNNNSSNINVSNNNNNNNGNNNNNNGNNNNGNNNTNNNNNNNNNNNESRE